MNYLQVVQEIVRIPGGSKFDRRGQVKSGRAPEAARAAASHTQAIHPSRGMTQQQPRVRVAFYVSGHGLGHATRVIQQVRELLRLGANVSVASTLRK